jgi:hypothetical protein
MLFACSKYPDCYGVYLDMEMPIKLVNTNGDDLLKTSMYGDSIEIYHVYEDGCAVLDYVPSADIKEGYYITGNIINVALDARGGHWHNDKLYYPDSPSKMENSITYIKWNSQDTDTIYATFIHLRATDKQPLSYGYCVFDFYDKVYYNGKQIIESWDDNQEKMSQGIYPTIIK